MQIGAVFPQTEFGDDPAALRDYAQTAEGLGYAHLVAYDHVLGADPNRPGGLSGPYTHAAPFLEPLALFSFMAAVTSRLGFATSVLILPQRQTALVAKQAATLDRLCGGRLRLGIGIGWNHVEYEALGQDFHTRGRRSEEQVELLRRLWTEPLVRFEGRWDRVPEAGINPLPIQRPIPIWFGGAHPRVLARAARLGDGWMPNARTPQDVLPALEALRGHLSAGGRDPAAFGVEARLPYAAGGPAEWAALIAGWQALGATHVSVNTMGAGLDSPAAHLAALRRFAEAVGLDAPAA